MTLTSSLSIPCPKCGEVIALDETIAGPLISQMKSERDEAISRAHADAQARIDALRDEIEAVSERERAIADREANLKSELNSQLAAERQKIAEEERINARKALAPEVEAQQKRTAEAIARAELAEKAELELRNEKEELDRRARTLNLEVARLVDAQRNAIQEQAAREAEESAKLKLAEKDKTIEDMRSKLLEAERKGAQGSQQLQGEVLELDFELTLRQAFPQDTVEPVKTGARGGDVLQHVQGAMGRPAGTIFWETKRAQAWGGDWTTKARHDAAEARAEIAVIVSEILPKGLRDFGLYENVWTVRPSHAIMLGVALRQGVISTANERQSAIGRDSKTERLYAYMTGPSFRATLEGIALPFQELFDELAAERRTTQARWRRQEKRIERVLTSVANLQGDLQGIAGAEMPLLPEFRADEGQVLGEREE
jgi:hypothetical protein